MREAALVLLACGLMSQPSAAQASPACATHGTVVSTTRAGIARASITGIQGARVILATSDSLGNFRVGLGAGEATLLIRAMGFSMQRIELAASRRDCAPLTVVLKVAEVQLPAVRASTRQATPGGRAAVHADDPTVGLSLRRGPVSPEQAGSIAATLAMTPGVAGTDGDDSPGFSVLGLPADQSVTTLNGARVEAEALPPDAGVLARVSTSAFDVSHGGFSGGELTLLTPPSGGFAVRRVTVSTALIPLTSAAEQPNMTPVRAMSGVVGQDLPGHAGAFRLSWNATEHVVPATTLHELTRATVGGTPLADSVSDLFQKARDYGLLTSHPTRPAQRSRTGSAMLGLDLGDWQSTRAHLSVLGNWRGNAGVFAPGLSAASHAGTDRAATGVAQIGATTSLAGTLNEFTLTATSRSHRSRASSGLPEIDVQLGGPVFDQNSTVYLGGNAALPRDNSSRSYQVRDEFSRYWSGERHLTKLTVSGIQSVVGDRSEAGSNGAYTFAGVGAFTSGSAESYYWSSAGSASASQRAFGASIGDDWVPRPSLQIQLGARLDADATSPRGQGQTWRLATMAVSPRIGFAWLPGRMEASEPAGPRGIIVRGGLGRFRATVPTADAVRVARSSRQRGQSQIVCIGAGIPSPDWESLLAGSEPAHSCVGGQASGGPGASDVAAVRFAPRFRPPSAFRAALGVSLPIWLRVDVDATYSAGTDNQSQVPTNIQSVAGMVLGDEGNRPALVSASQIEPETGIPMPGAGRADPAAPQVMELRSDARSRAGQLMLSVSPIHESRVGWQLTYTYQRASEQEPDLSFVSGATAQAGQSVAYAERWSRARREMRHQLVLSTSLMLPRGARLAAYYTGRSGLPYTPIVAGDVDGDGSGGDAAFIFDPDRGGDSALARSMRVALASAPASARRCLRAQVGRLARRDSCVGPWSGDASLTLQAPGQVVGAGRVTSIALQVVNVMAGADALFHGLRGAHGWGSAALPDPVLLRPAGFDASERRFIYQVNSGFGSPLTQSAGVLAPFSLSLSARITFGDDPDEQRLRAVLKDHSRDSVAVARRLRVEFGHTGISAAAVLLSRPDADWSDGTLARLRLLAAATEKTCDSLWGSIAGLAVRERSDPPTGAQTGPARGKPTGALLERVRQTRDEEFRTLAAAGPTVLAVLSPAERARLPRAIRAMLEPAAIERQRVVAASRGRGGSL